VSFKTVQSSKTSLTLAKNHARHALREHYSLTEAETEVANGLLTGYSLEEIAALRKVQVGTVRHQVKSMMAKTGTGKQTDMVRLLMTLPRMV